MAARPRISSRPVWSRRHASRGWRPHPVRSPSTSFDDSDGEKTSAWRSTRETAGSARRARLAAPSARHRLSLRSGATCAVLGGECTLVAGSLAGALPILPDLRSCTSMRTATSHAGDDASHYVGGRCLAHVCGRSVAPLLARRAEDRGGARRASRGSRLDAGRERQPDARRSRDPVRREQADTGA